MTKSAHFILFFCLILSACASDAGIVLDEKEIKFYDKKDRSKILLFKPKFDKMTDLEIESALIKNLSDRTSILLENGHGVTVEYTTSDGAAYLWYPGNARSVRGGWKISNNQSPPSICFDYPGAYNPVTRSAAQNCQNPLVMLSGAEVISSRSGDVFGLKHSIPYVKKKFSLPEWPEQESLK